MDHIWVMVDQDGAQTLFQFVDVGAASDAARLLKELHLPVVMIDVALREAARGNASPAFGGRKSQTHCGECSRWE